MISSWGDERHLDIELGELRLAIGSLGFIAEAAGDLEIAIQPGDHQQLLHLLRRLWQGIHHAGVRAARHQEVTCAFRCALDQHRGLDFNEGAGIQKLAHVPGDFMAQDQILLHCWPTQIEIAVLQAQALVDIDVLVDVERRSQRGVQDLDLMGLDLDGAGLESCVNGLRGAATHDTGDLEHVLVADRCSRSREPQGRFPD